MNEQASPANFRNQPALSSGLLTARSWALSLILALSIFAVAVGFLRVVGWFADWGEVVEEVLKASVAILLLQRRLQPAAVGIGFGTFELLLRSATGFHSSSGLVGGALLYWILVPLAFHSLSGWGYGAAKTPGRICGTALLMIGIHFMLNGLSGVPDVEGVPYSIWSAISLSVVATYVYLTIKSQSWSPAVAAAWLVPSSILSGLSIYLILTR